MLSPLLQIRNAPANNVAWVNAGNDAAVFNTTGGIVTLTDPITVGGLTFNVTGYSVTGNTLTLGTSSIFHVASGSASIDSLIAGVAANTLTVTGPGALNITNAANTFAGNIIVDGGTLRVIGSNGGTADPARLGQANKTITLQNGGTYVSHTTTTNPQGGAGVIKSFIIGAGGGTLQTDSLIQLDDANQFSGTGDLTKTGTNVLILNNNYSAYTGTTVNINAGTLRTNNVNGLGSGNATINVATGATFDIQANLNGLKPMNLSGSLIASGGTGTVDQTVTLTGNSFIGGNGTLNINTNITDGASSFSVTKNGTGLTVLNGANTYDGATNITAGTVRLDNANSIPGGLGLAGGTSNLNISGNAVVILNSTDLTRGLGAGATQARLTAGGGFAANGAPRTVNFGGAGAPVTWATADFLPGTTTLILGHTTVDNTLTFANGINLNAGTRTIQVDNGSAAMDAVLSGPITNGSITKTGAGTLALTNAGNTMSGIFVNSGALESRHSGALGGGAGVSMPTGTTLTFNGAAAADFAAPVTTPISARGSLSLINANAAAPVTLSGPLSLNPVTKLTFDGAGDIAVTSAFGNGTTVAAQANALSHFGYHINNDAVALNLHNNGGMMGGSNPANPLNGPSFFGYSLLTVGPGDRGLDFNDDNDFINSGAIGQVDNYSNLFVGTFTPNTTGNWSFRFLAEDDSSGIWVDLNQNGVFDSTGALGDNLGEQFRYDDTTTTGAIALTAGQSYLVAFTHRETGGGSQADVRFIGPAGSGLTTETVIRPTIAAQAGLWASLAVNADNTVTKTGAGTTTLAGANTYNGTTTIAQGTLVAAHDTALGLADGTPATGTSVASGATLAVGGPLAGGPVNIGNEHIALGANANLQNLGGNNSIAAQTIVVGNSISGTDNVSINAGAAGNRLQVGTNGGSIDLGFSQLRAHGAGEVTILSDISAASIGSSINTGVNGLNETIFNAASTAANAQGNIEFFRTLALGASDAAGVLTTHLTNPNDASVSTRATAMGAVGFDNGDYAHLWVSNFLPTETGNWGFRTTGNIDDNASFWVDLNQNGTFELGERFFSRACCGASGDQFTPQLVAGESYLLGIVMNDTGGGGAFNDMEFKAPSGAWLNLDPGANPNLFLASGQISNAPSTYHVVKDDPGILRLDGLLQFNGGVDVNAGIMIVNADNTLGGTPTGSWDVASGATLGGNGTINLAAGESVNIDGTPGIVSPGDAGPSYGGANPTFSMGLDAATVGTISFNAASATDTALNLDGILQLDVVDPATADMVVALQGIIDIDPTTAILTLNGESDFSLLDLGLLGIDTGDALLLISATDGILGEFSNNAKNGDTFTDLSGQMFAFVQDATSLRLVAGAVPEPTTIVIWTLLGIAGVGFALRQRKLGSRR